MTTIALEPSRTKDAGIGIGLANPAAASACPVRPVRLSTGRKADLPVEETTVEQTPDGAFRRQRNAFTARFGDAPGEVVPEFGRYHLLGAIGCGWNRRQRIVIRLLGLEEAFPVEVIYGRDEKGWKLTRTPGSVAEKFGFDRLNDFYRLTDPDYAARGTSPSVIDSETGKVVTNNYHVLSLDLETAWRPFHKEGAPDLYPEPLRQEIDLLNQQLFDDVNNGTYKIIFATNKEAAEVTYAVLKARLADYDFRLKSRRYLFGPGLTDSDVRLFQTLESFEHTYRPGIVEALGTDDVLHLWDFPNLWAYARDLFQTPGFIDDEELYTLGYTPDADGHYIPADLVSGDIELTDAQRRADYERWLEPAGREGLGGSPLYSGPGVGGSYELWQFARNVPPYGHKAPALPGDLLVRDLGDGLTLRLADPSEYEAVGETLYEAFRTNGPMTEFYKHRLLDVPRRSAKEDIWVIVDGEGTLYGACTTVKPEFNTEPTFEFNTMGVLPIGRGHGLGKAFVEHSIAVGKAYGYHKVLIHSGPNMQYAHRLYQRCGFVRHRELETLVVDGGQRLLVFTYDID